MLNVILTFHIVTLAWLFFRSAEFSTSVEYLEGLFAMRGGDNLLLTPLALFLIALGMLLHFMPRDGIERSAVVLRRVPAWGVAVFGVVVLVAIEAMGPEGVAPFIYYQF